MAGTNLIRLGLLQTILLNLFYFNLTPFPFIVDLINTFCRVTIPQISGFLPSKILYALRIYSFSLFVPELIESQYLVVCTSLTNCNDKTGTWDQNIFGMPLQFFTFSQSVDFAF